MNTPDSFGNSVLCVKCNTESDVSDMYVYYSEKNNVSIYFCGMCYEHILNCTECMLATNTLIDTYKMLLVNVPEKNVSRETSIDNSIPTQGMKNTWDKLSPENTDVLYSIEFETLNISQLQPQIRKELLPVITHVIQDMGYSQSNAIAYILQLRGIVK